MAVSGSCLLFLYILKLAIFYLQSIKIPKKVKDEGDSILWLKRLTSYIVSNVLYLRKFYDEESFLAVPYETTKLRVLSKKSKNPNVLSVIDYLEGLHFFLVSLFELHYLNFF